MTQCPHCNTLYQGVLVEGSVLHCVGQNCMKLFWVFDGHSYLVPQIIEISQSIESIGKADDRNESNWFIGNNLLFYRLNQDFSSIIFGENESHNIRPVTSESPRNLQILRFVRERVEPYGLICTRLNEDEEPRGNDPFIVHRRDTNPFDFEFIFEHDAEQNIVGNEEDPRWEDWGNGFSEEIFNNLGFRINGQQLRPQQNQALEWMMSRPSTLTIAALPTGYGKSRIMQIASILLNHGVSSGLNRDGGTSGPVLIISPLISLRDDQRDRWDEFNDSLADGVDKLRC